MPGGDGLAALEAARSPPRIVRRGESLYEQGQPSDRSYTLLTGWIAIHNERQDGRRQIVAFAMPGDVLIAERHNGGTWGATAVAVGDVIVCSISRARHDRLRRAHPDYDDLHFAHLQRMIQSAYDLIASLGLGDANQRIAHLLLGLATRSLGRRAVERTEVIHTPLSQIDIGLATGLTPVHVSRTLRRLREDGVLDLRQRSLRILDLHRLEVLAGVAGDRAAHSTQAFPGRETAAPQPSF